MMQIDAHDFRDIIVHMKMCMIPPRGLYLHLHTVTEYRRMRCYIDGDIKSYFGGGFAIDEAGGLTNMFSLRGGGQGDRLVQEAIALGARSLDCYDGHLVRLYQRNGFVEVGREPWNDKFADPRWNKNRWGTPDVVFMKLNNTLDAQPNG